MSEKAKIEPDATISTTDNITSGYVYNGDPLPKANYCKHFYEPIEKETELIDKHTRKIRERVTKLMCVECEKIKEVGWDD